MIPLSILDLSPIVEGGDAGQSLRNSLDLARHAEALGLQAVLACRAPQHAGHRQRGDGGRDRPCRGGTSTIRVGAGGIMLPNHAPLVIAEQFGTLAALYPGRIDLGLGRAPGLRPVDDARAAAEPRSTRRRVPAGCRRADGLFRAGRARPAVQAVPGAGLDVPIWILGSSLYRRPARGGARPALCLRLAFRAGGADEAIAIYRARFKPSARLDKPYVMLGINVIRGGHRRRGEAAVHLAAAGLRQPAERPAGAPAAAGGRHREPSWCRRQGDARPGARLLGRSARPTRSSGARPFIARTGADELMVTAQIFDHHARLRSFELTAEVHGQLAAAA